MPNFDYASWLRSQHPYYQDAMGGNARPDRQPGGHAGFDWVWTLSQGPRWEAREGMVAGPAQDVPHFADAQDINRRFEQRFPGMIPLPAEYVGGTGVGRLHDPNKVRYDDDFGYYTNAANIKEDNSWLDWAPWALAAIPAIGILGPAALGEAGAFEGAVAGGELGEGLLGGGSGGLFGTIPEYGAGVELPELVGVPDFGGNAFAGAQQGGSVNGGFLDALTNPSDLPGWIAQNPGDALRILMGAGSLLNTATHSNSVGAPGLLSWQNGPMPGYTPDLRPYQPNPNLLFPVPFMGGR